MRKEEEQGVWAVKAMTQVLLGGVIATAASLLVLFLCAVLISRGVLGQEHIDTAAVAACVVGSLVGGVVAVSRCKGRSMIVGLLTGVALFLILLTLGVLLYQTVALEDGGVPLGCACLCGGALSGLFGARPKKKRRK